MRHIKRLYIFFMVLLSIVLFLSACQAPAVSTDNASAPADTGESQAEVAAEPADTGESQAEVAAEPADNVEITCRFLQDAGDTL